MDHRRLLRTVIDPKIRQVGFVTGGATASASEPSPAAPPLPSSPPAADISTGSSLSPVMIPPPRHASLPIPVSNPPMLPLRRQSLSIGSYTPSGSETLIDGASEFDVEIRSPARLRRTSSGKTLASSFPGTSGELMGMTVGGNSPVVSSLTTAATVKVLPGVSEIDGGAFVEMHAEGAGTPKTTEPKPTKAERRALQEAQRAAKKQSKESGTKVVKPPPQKKDVTQVTATATTSETKIVDRLTEKDRKKDIPHPRMQFDDKHRVEKAKRRAVVNQSEAGNRVELFRHLPQYVHGTLLPDLESKFFQLDPMHPSVYKVGLQYLSGDISGGNARCIAMLLAFQEAIKDYTTPPEKVLSRDLTAKIGSYVSFLIECRPLSISMGNAIKFLKNRIAKLPHNLSEAEAKSSLQSDIDRFINEKIILADKVIVRHAVTKIRDGDVLLTYGSSCVVEMIMLYAHEVGKQFRVVVVDSRPKLEGRALLRRLVAEGISCTYTHINAISYIMNEVTRVFLGASSVLSNGTVYSRVGTASVAMVAHAFRVPVLICCEAYKFHERVQLDSICSNELGDPNVISKIHGRKDLNYLDNWTDNKNLQLLNLSYDAMPSDYVSMIVTDYGMLPPTSVPVIVREYRRENLWI